MKSLKILNRLETSRVIEKRYGEKVSFEDGIKKLKEEYLCTVLNIQKSKRKHYAITESILK